MTKKMILCVLSGMVVGVLLMSIVQLATKPETEVSQIGQRQVKVEKKQAVLPSTGEITSEPAQRPLRPSTRRGDQPFTRRGFDQWFAQLQEANKAKDSQKISELIEKMPQQRQDITKRREQILQRRQDRLSNTPPAPDKK